MYVLTREQFAGLDGYALRVELQQRLTSSSALLRRFPDQTVTDISYLNSAHISRGRTALRLYVALTPSRSMRWQ